MSREKLLVSLQIFSEASTLRMASDAKAAETAACRLVQKKQNACLAETAGNFPREPRRATLLIVCSLHWAKPLTLPPIETPLIPATDWPGSVSP
jgi:hypothetical protein